jgi:hypothetical protein
LTFLVAQAALARPNNVVTPYALARQRPSCETAFPMWKTLSRHSCWRNSIVLSRHWEWRDKTNPLKNHNSLIRCQMKIKISMKIVSLDEIYNFVVLSFFI